MVNEDEEENRKEIDTGLDPDGTPINGYEIAESKKREANEEDNDFYSEDVMNDLDSLEDNGNSETLNDLDYGSPDADAADDVDERNDDAGKV